MKSTNRIIRVLIVDDNIDIHADMKKIFKNTHANPELKVLEEFLFKKKSSKIISENYHFEIGFANQGEEGLAKVKDAIKNNNPYSVAILDIRMPPGWDGVKTALKIWEVDQGLEVIFCSAYSDYELNDIYEKLEWKETFLFVKKPFSPIEIRQAVISLAHKSLYRNKLERQIEQAQEQLLQADKMASIGQLAAGVAHEINNPVGYIHSNINTLQKYLADIFNLIEHYSLSEKELNTNSDIYKRIIALKESLDLEYLKEDTTRLINETCEGVGRVKKIIQALKNFSYQGEQEMELYDLNKGIESTLNIVNNEIKYKAKIIKILGDIPQIEVVGSQINQVILNILINASHAIKENGTITIETTTVNDKIYLKISDDGTGINKEHLSKIFDPFFTTKPIGHGTGLGLSLAYGIIQNHNGLIDVKSEPGQGTCFTMEFPIDKGTLYP